MGGLTTEKQDGGGTETLVDNVSFSGSSLAAAEWTDHRLIYLTPELKESLHISGVPEVTVKLASSKPAANLSVWLEIGRASCRERVFIAVIPVHLRHI